jgi:hypothetical protein
MNENPAAWELRFTTRFKQCHERYRKKHEPELTAVLANVERYRDLLRYAAKPRDVHAGYIHPEKKGVVAISQRGHGKNLAETRLYAYPLIKSREVCLITIGDKDSQQNDIKFAVKFVNQLPNSLQEF